ncbi:ArnT family glycosyltransferase [Nocardia stercoris]|uniref:Phospholipid carrier-dependent glycosyltransferase n=1 Tax=Nocardia stercoris TaxID=2483361 RepID=A0A3M2L295_9NOCA|nr:glycosyltransferase family 39 protein [Nocardia stercoris]RMI31757.1 phospholipid carrier-dependent glycosyltransferase [Nocardia stercoris]
MTLLADPPEQVIASSGETATAAGRAGSIIRKLWAHTAGHRHGLAIVGGLALLCLVATSVNLAGYPIRFGDEGVYVAQAWAVPNEHALSHYTYWYDHPPLGWLQLSAWFELTDGLGRWAHDTTVAGREFMVVDRIAVCALLFVLARRLGMRRFWAGIAVAMWILSPAAMHYGRLVLLDNIALPWLLAAFALALSPRRTWGAAVGSAVCFAFAVTTKETMAVAAPALLYQLWSNYRRASNRDYAWVSFAIVFAGTVGLYPLYAILKNELIPGPGHVSLVGTIGWQLSARKPSGSVFDPHSDAYNLVHLWLHLDPLLPVAGVIAAAVLMVRPRFRPVMVALLSQVIALLRPGYLPAMYIDALLPLMALAVAGLGDTLWPRSTRELPARVTDTVVRLRSWVDRRRSGDPATQVLPTLAGFVPRLLPGSGTRAATAGPPKLSVVPPPESAAGRPRSFSAAAGYRRARPLLALAGAVLVLVGSGGLATAAVSRWTPTLNHQWSADDDRSERAVVDWLGARVPHDAVLVSEGELWLDLHDAGFAHANNVWVYKVDSDPAVQRQLGRWQNIDYLALSHATLTSESQATMPWVFDAIRNADIVTTFGIGDDRVTVLKVRK